ncbi:hypothetical protein [Paraburkholderia caffeinilytica]|uniref:hypothetical protein n=1 Tax=Paraburkholderia caffeinilytica TaxID=1761016 RepID=UPI003DA0391A
MYLSKTTLLILLGLAVGILHAAPSWSEPCKVTFHDFVVDRDPKGYPVNRATLTVTGYDVCLRRDGSHVSTKERPFDTEVLLKHTHIDVEDLVTHKHSYVQTPTSIAISRKRHLAELSNNYLAQNIELPIEVKGSKVIVKVTQPPRRIFGDPVAPAYSLRLGSELIIDAPN